MRPFKHVILATLLVTVTLFGACRSFINQWDGPEVNMGPTRVVFHLSGPDLQPRLYMHLVTYDTISVWDSRADLFWGEDLKGANARAGLPVQFVLATGEPVVVLLARQGSEVAGTRLLVFKPDNPRIGQVLSFPLKPKWLEKVTLETGLELILTGTDGTQVRFRYNSKGEKFLPVD